MLSIPFIQPHTLVQHILKGKFMFVCFFFLNLDLISGMKYVHLLTAKSLVKVDVLWTLFSSLEIRVYLSERTGHRQYSL